MKDLSRSTAEVLDPAVAGVYVGFPISRAQLPLSYRAQRHKNSHLRFLHYSQTTSDTCEAILL